MAIAFGLFILTLLCTLLAHRVYLMLIPGLDGLKGYLQEALVVAPERSMSTAALLRKPTAEKGT